MNILAHLHLATLAESSLIGNVVADFVRGDPYRQYPALVADGIMMHRRVDALVDSIPEVKQAKKLFVPQHQRIALITLDIVWDHFLSKQWCQFVDTVSLTGFNQQTKNIISQDLVSMPEAFQRFMGYLWQGHWLENYAKVDFIGEVLCGMAKRRPRLALLADSFTDFVDNYAALESLFHEFYPILVNKARNKNL